MAKYYTRITLRRMSELLDLTVDVSYFPILCIRLLLLISTMWDPIIFHLQTDNTPQYQASFLLTKETLTLRLIIIDYNHHHQFCIQMFSMEGQNEINDKIIGVSCSRESTELELHF